jgi:hypothetical protein
VVACIENDGQDAVGDGGNVDLDPGSAAVAAVRIMSGNGNVDVDLESEAHARLQAWLGFEGGLQPSRASAPAFAVIDSTAFLVAPRWPRFVQRGTAAGLLLEPATRSLQGGIGCPLPRASRQGLAACAIGAGATMTVEAAEGTLSLRVLQVTTETVADAAAVSVVEQGIPDRTIPLTLSPFGFLRGTVPPNASSVTDHRVGIRNATTAPLVVVLPSIHTGARSTPTAVAGERGADDWFLEAPPGVERVAFDVTRLDFNVGADLGASHTVIGDIVAGERLLRLQLRAEVAELVDLDSGDAVASGRLPAAGTLRVEVGRAAGDCGDTCVRLDARGPIDAVFLGAPEQDDGSSDGVILERIDMFDR